MKKKILSMLMVLALMLGLLPAAAPHAHAEGGSEASVTIDGVTMEVTVENNSNLLTVENLMDMEFETTKRG